MMIKIENNDDCQFGPMLASSLHSGHNVYSYSQVAKSFTAMINCLEPLPRNRKKHR